MPALGGKWVRIRIGNGQWVAGWFDADSYVSCYPEPRDIYIAYQYEVDRTGRIGGILPQSAGVWLSLKEGDIIEWLNHPNDNAASAQGATADE